MTIPTITPKTIADILNQADCLHSADEVQTALDEMGVAITEKLQHKNPIILCVMTGAVIPTGHLLTRLHFPLELDYIHATRYQGTNKGGALHWQAEPRTSLKDRVVLIVDDILDGGLTLQAIRGYCLEKGASEVYTAVMVDKPRTREPGVNLTPDFIGVTTENRYLFGFGLDYHNYLRNVPGIYAVGKGHEVE